MSLENVFVFDHPVIQTKLTELRDKHCDHRKFRALLNEIGSLMVYEVTRDWPTTMRKIETPIEAMEGRVLARKVTLVPILRAGTSACIATKPPCSRRRTSNACRPISHRRKSC